MTGIIMTVVSHYSVDKISECFSNYLRRSYLYYVLHVYANSYFYRRNYKNEN